MFYLFNGKNSKTPINTRKPFNCDESRRNHIKKTRVYQETLKTLVFIMFLRDR